ncbi:MAG: cation:proton antiporter [Bacteroidales bacterium]
MNTLLTFGLLLIFAYVAGLLFDKAGLPRIIGYILIGVAFSPDTINIVNESFIGATRSLMDISLAFIAFEVGGELKWSKIKAHKKEILCITALEGVILYTLIAAGTFVFGLLFPEILPFGSVNLILFVLLLGALGAPTAPAATIAVMHQYRSRGKVSNTIMGVVALDDVIGILLFSLTISVVPVVIGKHSQITGTNILIDPLYQIVMAVITGGILGFIVTLIGRYLRVKGEGQWVIIIFSLLILCVGITKLLEVDELLAYMTMGVVTANTCRKQKLIFNLLERYTENFIFLIFFLLSGLHLDISAIPQAAPLIILFVLLRSLGKYLGVYSGARLAKSDQSVRKYVAGGLIPQAGIVIGLILSIHGEEGFADISDMLLATIMGATIINELIGPVLAKYSLMKAGDINRPESTRQ